MIKDETKTEYKAESKPTTINSRRRISSSKDGLDRIKSNLTGNQKIQIRSQEYFGVLCLNNKNEVNDAQVLHIGSAVECLVTPRDLFRYVLQSDSVRFITWHNHPSGDVTPSPEDLALIKRITDGAEILGVEQLDSLIINSNFENYLSLRDLGYI